MCADARAIGMIADDYTGALMVACYLEGVGIYCPLVFDPSAIVGGAPVVVAGTRTRTIAAQDAIAEIKRMADAFAAAGYSRLVYKTSGGFDSTVEGNIGPAADYLADRTGLRPVVMAAGFPEFNITTHFGCLFYRGRLVSESIKRFDPLTPMSDPDLVRFVSRQTSHGVGSINHLQMRKGREELARIADGEALSNGHILFDVSDEDDLRIVARFAAERRVVLVASDPVAVEYARILAADSERRVSAPGHAEGPAAVLVGTVGPVILAQLEAFSRNYPVLTLDLISQQSQESIVAQALNWASRHVGTGPFAISTAADAARVERTQQALGSIGAARRAESILGSVAQGLHDRGVRRFVVAGGETSGAVVDALGIRSVRAFPKGTLGTGFCVTEGSDPISLFLKPGKHGGSDILLEALAQMDTR